MRARYFFTFFTVFSFAKQAFSMTIKELQNNIRVIEDFPKAGIHFQDVTTLFMKPDCLKEIGERIYDLYKDKGITKVVGLESRGFIMGGIIADRLGAGFIPARKKESFQEKKFLRPTNSNTELIP